MIIELNEERARNARQGLIDGMYEALRDSRGRPHNKAAHVRNCRMIQDWEDDGLIDEDEADSLRWRNDSEFNFWQRVTIL
nr:MAG TPA_asm: hypothetical protein [Bacteriophage sp.]